jgi:hypothetical protein
MYDCQKMDGLLNKANISNADGAYRAAEIKKKASEPPFSQLPCLRR